MKAMTTRYRTQLLLPLSLVIIIVTGATANINVTHRVPDCVQLTLTRDEYVIESNARLVLDGDVVINEGDYELSKNNASAQVCYVTSDNLRRCLSRVALPVGRYVVERNRSVSAVRTGQLYPLGEYFIDAEGSAVVCQHCNYLSMKAEEYSFAEVNETFTILRSNVTFYSPKYAIDPITKDANVCYPIVPRSNCTWGLLEGWSTVILPDKRVQDKPSSRIYELDEFVTLPDGETAICIQVVEPTSLNRHIRKVCIIIFVVSAACLAIAIIVHLVVDDLSLQRVPLLCHAFSLMLLYIALTVRHLCLEMLEYSFCKALFYVTYMAGLSSFAWLTVLAFDVWRISCCLRNNTGDGYKWADRFCSSKFLLYSIFGWGVPAVFGAFVAVMDHYLTFQDALGLYPDIVGQCWFNGSYANMALWYIPMAVLLGFNFILFFASVINLCIANRSDRPFVNIRLNQQLLAILFVVFMAMGVFWVMDVVSFFDTDGTTGTERWLFADVINGFQGLVIAVVYTCHPFVWKKKKQPTSYEFNEKF